MGVVMSSFTDSKAMRIVAVPSAARSLTVSCCTCTTLVSTVIVPWPGMLFIATLAVCVARYRIVSPFDQR